APALPSTPAIGILSPSCYADLASSVKKLCNIIDREEGALPAGAVQSDISRVRHLHPLVSRLIEHYEERVQDALYIGVSLFLLCNLCSHVPDLKGYSITQSHTQGEVEGGMTMVPASDSSIRTIIKFCWACVAAAHLDDDSMHSSETISRCKGVLSQCRVRVSATRVLGALVYGSLPSSAVPLDKYRAGTISKLSFPAAKNACDTVLDSFGTLVDEVTRQAREEGAVPHAFGAYEDGEEVKDMVPELLVELMTSKARDHALYSILAQRVVLSEAVR
ncbi:hypothetical protein KIPB_009576, partial [Kipferlia bialata]